MVEISLYTPSTSIIDQEVDYLLLRSLFALTRRADLLELQSIIPSEQMNVAEPIPDEKPAVAGPGPKSKKRQTTINIDSSDEETPTRLKKVKAEAGVKLEKGVKQEKDGKPKKPTVIVIDDDSD